MNIWVFWAIAACLTVAVAAIMARAMTGSGTGGLQPDLQIYRDQLTEVDRDVARGTLPEDEAERLRTEISRRVLDADKTRNFARPTRHGSAAIGASLVALALICMVPVYLHLGAPGYPDLPNIPRLSALESARNDRPTQAEAEAQAPPADERPAPDPQFAALVAQLRDAVARHPTDLRGQRLLARNEAALGNFAQAAAAQQQVLKLVPDASASDHALLAELMAYAAGGYISPEGEAVLKQALARDPEQPLALYLSGLMMAQGGRDDLAFRYWNKALEMAPADAPWRATVIQAMPYIAMQAGMRWTPPPALPGPTADDVQAMSALPEADRTVAIQGMVEGLATRLQQTGGSADEWARLITAYGVLGRDDDARAAWQTASATFAGAELATIHTAAIQAGVAE